MARQPDPPALLIISRNLPPVIGGIERLMHRLTAGLAARRPCIVIGPRGCRLYLPAQVRVIELPHRPAVLFVVLALLLTTVLVVARRLCAILAGNGLMSIAALPARLRRVPVVTMVYGLDIVVDNRLYQALCLPLIGASAAVIACSSNSARLAVEHGVPATRVHAIMPGVDPPPAPASGAPAGHAEAQSPVLLSVGRLVRRKGIADFIRHALPRIVQRYPAVHLVVIGSAPVQALRREASELERAQAAIADTDLAGHVSLLGHVSDADLAAWMSKASAHVFPLQEIPGDVEGFGLVALEAAACGLPTVAFDAGGVSDAIEPGGTGILVPPGDFAAFADAVCEVLARGKPHYAPRCCAYARENSWARHTDAVDRMISAVQVQP